VVWSESIRLTLKTIRLKLFQTNEYIYLKEHLLGFSKLFTERKYLISVKSCGDSLDICLFEEMATTQIS